MTAPATCTLCQPTDRVQFLGAVYATYSGRRGAPAFQRFGCRPGSAELAQIVLSDIPTLKKHHAQREKCQNLRRSVSGDQINMPERNGNILADRIDQPEVVEIWDDRPRSRCIGLNLGRLKKDIVPELGRTRTSSGRPTMTGPGRPVTAVLTRGR